MVDPLYLVPGTYVDTITVTVAGAAGSPARLVDSLTVRGAAAQYVTIDARGSPVSGTGAFVERTTAQGASVLR